MAEIYNIIKKYMLFDVKLTKSSFRKIVHHSTFGLIVRCCLVVAVVTVTSVYIVIFVGGLTIRQDRNTLTKDHSKKHVVFLKIPKTGEDYLESLLEKAAKQNGVPFVKQGDRESKSQLEQRVSRDVPLRKVLVMYRKS